MHNTFGAETEFSLENLVPDGKLAEFFFFVEMKSHSVAQAAMAQSWLTATSAS